jgi:hypothetical protein
MTMPVEKYLQEREQAAANGKPAAHAHIFERASDLLKRPHPGPTPFLIEELIVAQAVACVLGLWKVGKTWSLLEFAVCVVSGEPAFGRYAVPQPGPVVLVVEESGRDALYRRLDPLSRGHNLTADHLEDLHFAANRGVRLDDPVWREDIKAQIKEIRPRLTIFDPLVRVKGAANENVQAEMAPILDFFRDLRNDTESAVLYAHHTGHKEQGRQRGSSDLEGYWESKLTLTADRRGVSRTILAEHREAPITAEFDWALRWHAPSETIALTPTTADPDADLPKRVEEYVTKNPGKLSREIAKGVGKRGEKVQGVLDALVAAGQLWKSSGRRDNAGQPLRKGGYYVNDSGTIQPELGCPDERDNLGQPAGEGHVARLSHPRGRNRDNTRDGHADESAMVDRLKREFDAEEVEG